MNGLFSKVKLVPFLLALAALACSPLSLIAPSAPKSVVPSQVPAAQQVQPSATPVVVIVPQVIVVTATPQSADTAAGKTTAQNVQDATSTSVPASQPTSVSEVQVTNAYTMPAFTVDLSHGAWMISGTERLGDNPIVETWIKRLLDPDPAHWRVYPNIANPDLKTFDVHAGAEYGVANVPFCQQDQRCDFVVPGWHYRLITARYNFLGMNCEEGCMLIIVNVMDKTMTWRNQMADNGFTVAGRYWDGDKLDQAIEGLVSNTAANMLGMPTLAHPDEVLNSGNGDNAGANCGDVKACAKVNATVVVTAGDAVLAVLRSTIMAPSK